MDEGGWNCDWVEGSQRASFHSTLNTMVGLLDHEVRTGATPALVEARHRAEEYLLQRELMRSLATGAVHEPWATHWAYPFRYYTVIRAADHFRAAPLHDGVAPTRGWARPSSTSGTAAARRDVAPAAAPRGAGMVPDRRWTRAALAVAGLSRPAGAALVGAATA